MHWVTPPMLDGRGRIIAWTGPLGGQPVGYLARFTSLPAAND